MNKEKMSMHSIRFLLVILVLVVTSLTSTANAMAEFGVVPGSFDGLTADENGKAMMQAGAHPFSHSTGFELNTVIDPGPGEDEGLPVPDGGNMKNVTVDVPPGLVGNPLATPRCPGTVFIVDGTACPDDTQIGVATVTFNLFGRPFVLPVQMFNVEPPPGKPAMFGFWVGFFAPAYVYPTVRSDGDYGFTVHVDNVDQSVSVSASKLTFWGNPASPSHDMERGNFLYGQCNDAPTGQAPYSRPCPSDAPEIAFLTNPQDCSQGPLSTNLLLESWKGASATASFLSHDEMGNPTGVTGCDRVPFQPTVSSKPSSSAADSPVGLTFDVKVPDAGLLDPAGIAQSPIKKTVVRLPDGVSLNPSAANGLGSCTPSDYAREKLDTQPGAGCPNASRVGSVEIETPLLEEHLNGSVYLAQPDDPATKASGAENPFDSFMAVYLVARSRERGIILKLPGRVELDPKSGQVVTTFDNLPQLPFSNLRVQFRAGERAPLVSPPRCGSYTTVTEMLPWSAEDPSETKVINSPFEVTQGPNGGECPPEVAAFHPGFLAGSTNNAAGSFSPFEIRLSRNEGEQELTRFSSVLPEGVLARIAGVNRCADEAVAVAKAKTGMEEMASPSCPSGSEIGTTLAGAGAGSVLTRVSGHVYLAGPYHGAPLSVIAITPAVAGPFDVGTVVVRQALRINPVTAQATVDGSISDSIPHILKGIKLNLRDLQVRIDRPQFTTTPTSCDPTRVAATLFGAGLDPFSSADDSSADLANRYQAASCLNLGFRPRLSLKLSGPTHRSAHPALRATLKMPKGGANIAKTTVLLPETEFIDNAHIANPCTRVQFDAGKCPAGSILGTATAYSPLLDKPLRGPVYFRSNGGARELPDLVADLDGQIHVTLVGFIDSVKTGKETARVRTRFLNVPDAPVSKFVLNMKGGKKGLLVNNEELCRANPRARAEFTGQNGKRSVSNPLVKLGCAGGKKRK
jgi:hypothetical protein